MMHLLQNKWILALPCFLSWLAGSAQNHSVPVDTWAKDLSSKEDFASLKFYAVYDQLLLLDQGKRCVALSELENRAAKSNRRAQIRVAMLNAILIMGSKACEGSPSTNELLEKALRQAYELEDNILASQANKYLGDVYLLDRDYGMAVMYKYVAYELRKKAGEENFKNVATDLYHMGDLLYHTRDYHEAIRITNEAVVYPGNSGLNHSDTLNNYWEMNALNVVGLSHERLGQYDSALIAFDQASALAHDAFWKGLIEGNRGDVFFLQEHYDSAEPLLKLDYENSLAAQEYNNAALSLQRLARITSWRGDHQRALTMIREADMLERRMQHPDYRIQILYAYALVFKELNLADSTFYYMQQHNEKTKILEMIAAKDRADIVKLRMDNMENVYRILELSKEKHRITLIRNFSIAFILVFAALGLLFINRQRLRAKLKQQEALEGKQRAEAETQNARDQLIQFTESLREKTKLIEDLQSRMLQKELNQDQIEQIQELSQHTILTDADWEQFKSLFTRVYPGFFVDLKRKVSDITLAEQRMAALIKLQISNKDAATMLGISPNSIHKTRQRLRQRLGLEQDSELDNYFRNS